MRFLYLDMDGVLADFDKRYAEITGMTCEEARHLPTSTFWAELGDAKFNIYRELEPMSDAYDLVDGVLKRSREGNYTVGVLTAIPKFGKIPMAAQHKRDWIEYHFPMLAYHFHIGPWAQDKQKHCLNNDILIDDSHMNIPQWQDAGGHGILHTSAVDSLYHLDMILEKLNGTIRN